MRKHYHWYVNYVLCDRETRTLDPVPYTSREACEKAIRENFLPSDKAKPLQLDATETYGAFHETH